MRLTFKETNGRFGVIGMNAENEHEKAYSCICKLLEYEETGYEPSEILQIDNKISDIERRIAAISDEYIRKIKLGSEIQGYIVTALTETSCMAERKYKKSAEDYVVWNIDRDKFGVNNGRYFDEKEDAVLNFSSRLYRTRP